MIRQAAGDDLAPLYRATFPDEDLTGLVAALSGRADVLSLVADDGAVAGHAMFAPDASRTCALIGPLAVRPDRQRQGIGRSLMETGMRRLSDAGIRRVFLLGDPAYYGRLGFTAEEKIQPPCPIPGKWRAAWQSRSLPMTDIAAAPPLPDRLILPEPWMDPALWSG